MATNSEMPDSLKSSAADSLHELRAKVAQLEGEVERLRECQSQLRRFQAVRDSFLERTPLAVINWSRDFRVVEWNAGAERIFGYTAAEAVGNHGCDLLVSPEVRGRVERVFSDLLQGQGGTRSTNDNITRDGRRIRCEWYNTPLFDEQGNVIGVASMTHDVTDEEALEQAVRQSEGLLRSIVENAPDIIMRIDRQGRISFINHVADQYKREDVIGNTMYDFVPEDHRPIVASAIEQVFRTRVPFEYEVPDTVAAHWYHTRLAPIVENDQVDHLVAICLDVTDRKLQEEKLHRMQAAREQSEAMFRILAQNVPGVVYLCRNDERYSMLFLNDAIKTLVGIPAEEFLQDRQSFVDLYHPDDATAIPPIVNAAIGRRMPYHLTYRLRRADDSYLWVEEYGQGVFDTAGQLQFLEGTIFDITAKRAAVEALQRSKEELEAQVDARTQQLRMANRLLRSDYQRQLDLTRELKASEQQFRVMCDANPAAVTIARLSDAEIIYANERMVELLGVPANQVIGRKTIEFYHDLADRQLIRDTLLRERQMRGHEIQVRRPDGQVLWVNFSMCVLDLAEGPCVLGIMLDVTQRRQYDERLRVERRRLRRLLELNQRDRQLIAFEIHDGFVQDVTGAIMFLQSSARRIPPDGPAQKDLNQGVDILRSAIDEARRLIDGLQPGVLEEQGVVEGIRYLAQQTERMHEIVVELDMQVSFDRLAPAVEQAIYRIVQEGLTNVVKHSQSPRARVTLSQRTDALVIKVRDWGIGFDTQTTKTRRYGLTGIRDRARLLGGEATIRSEIGRGTKLRIRLPLQDVLIPPDPPQPLLGDDDSSSDFASASDDSESSPLRP